MIDNQINFEETTMAKEIKEITDLLYEKLTNELGADSDVAHTIIQTVYKLNKASYEVAYKTGYRKGAMDSIKEVEHIVKKRTPVLGGW